MTTVGSMVPGADGGLLVVIRFDDGSGRTGQAGHTGHTMDALRDACALLSAQGGLRQAIIGRATDDRDLIVLTLEWESVGAYRQALSNFDVKVSVVPLLSQAIDEPTAFEILHARDEHGARDSTGALARDAGSVSLGEAAAGYVPPAS